MNKEESAFTKPVEIRGNESQCDMAKQLIDELIEDEPVICKLKFDSFHLCINIYKVSHNDLRGWRRMGGGSATGSFGERLNSLCPNIKIKDVVFGSLA